MPENAEDPLAITTRVVGPTAVIELDGEFDLGGVTAFASTVEWLLDQRPKVVEIDATSLSFVDSSGLKALVSASRSADARGSALRLVNSSEPLDRLLGMTGLRPLLTASQRAGPPVPWSPAPTYATRPRARP